MGVLYRDNAGMTYQRCSDGEGFSTIFIINEHRQVVSEISIADDLFPEFFNDLQEVENHEQVPNRNS